MADVFISYAREDRARAEQIANGLAAQGLASFWDTDIPPGQTWADYIEGKLGQCKAVVVLWSETSTKSQWVREEARMGRDKSKLIPVRLDASAPPFGFGEVQAADLSTWRGEPNHPEWVRFAQAVRTVAGVQTAPPQASAPHHPAPMQPQPVYAAAPSASGAIEQLSPIGYVQKCLRLYVNGRGRARRSEFGWFLVFNYLALLLGVMLDVASSGLNPYTEIPNDSYALTIIIGLALVAPAIAVTSRRAHDFGQSGWLAILTAIPYLGFVVTLVFIFIPSQAGANQHGPNPKGL